MAHSFVRNYIHLIYSTKNRERYLRSDIRKRLWDYTNGIIRNVKSDPIEVNGHEEHCHILFQLHPTLTLSKAVQTIKANTSKWLSETYPELHEFSWQEGYAGYSVSSSQVNKVIEYIQNQEEHHKRVSFQEEYIAFLKAYGIEYDERYVLG